MASTNKTSKLKLNKWLGSDKIQRVDFNNDNDIIEQEFLDRSINVKWFGAKGDGSTDDTVAIQNTINSVQSGDTLIIPKGNFIITNLVFDLPDDSFVICLGTLKSNTNGVAVKIGNESTQKNRINIQGLKVVRPTALNWTNGSIGIQLINLYDSVIDIRNVYGFETNIECLGINTKGFSYNEVHLGKNYNAKKSLYLNQTNNGWCNENNFYGGRFDFTGEISDFTGCVAITTVHSVTNVINNNRFYSPSLEALNSSSKAFEINGYFNEILFPRIERIGAGEFTSNSQYCTFFAGYGYNSYVTDNGARNKILANDNWKIAGSSNTNAIITAQNVYGASERNFSGQNTSGTETFHVKGDGTGFFAGGIRLFQSAYGVYTGTGSPEGVVTASPGSLYLNRSGGAGQTLWVKETGSGNTGWIAK